jgi:hypothetical protein
VARTRSLRALCAALAAGCAAPAPPPPPPPPAAHFSAEAAWEHLAALVAAGPRPPGSPGAQRAQAHARASLEGLGLAVREERETVADRGDGQPLEVVNLVAEIPGDSPDLFVLAAGLDTKAFEHFDFVGANEASGAALLLELARVLRERPLPYTVRLVLLGAEVPQGELAPGRAFWSSRLLVEGLAEEGRLARVRLVVYFGAVGDADLAIARDLRSHRMYRDAFFEAAHELGHGGAFPLDAGFDSVVTGHHVFLDAGVRRAVALSDPRYGGAEPPGPFHHSELDTLERLSAASLEAVGRSAERGLEEIAARLRRVDRFAARRAVEEEEPEPAPAPAPEAPAPAPEGGGAPPAGDEGGTPDPS